MRTIILVVAGALSLSTAFGQSPGFEERFKMKTGRYSPAEEARREKAALVVKQAIAKPVITCDKHGCCTPAGHAVAKTAATLGDPGAEARFRLKYGRNSQAEEARVAVAKRPASEPVLLAGARICEADCCKHDQ